LSIERRLHIAFRVEPPRHVTTPPKKGYRTLGNE
jgi:hypothetical protein